METVTIHVAKTMLSHLPVRVEAGEEIVLAGGKVPLARLVPFQPPASKRQSGKLRGVISVGEGFFDPLPEEEVAAWE